MIELKNVSFRYNEGEDHTISSLNLKIKQGEFILLCGRSGCGKTTLTRFINGLIPRFYEGSLEGDVLISGKNVRDLKFHQISKLVGSVFQDPRSQFFTMDTTSEIAFFSENRGIARNEIVERLHQTAITLHIENLLDRNIYHLSSGEKQKIAIASIYAAGPSIYVLDEPSANLDYQAADELKKVLAMLKNLGCTIIVAEHRLYYLKDLVDRVIYMDQGKIIEEYDQNEFLAITEAECFEKGLRSLEPAELTISPKGCVENYAQPSLYLDNVSFGYQASKQVIHNLSLTAYQGEIIGIVGLNGDGKSTFAKILSGLLKENKGSIRIKDKEATAKIRLKKIYFVMQEADYQLFTASVTEEVLLGNEDEEQLRDKAAKILADLNLSCFRDRHPATLSGGQKQKVTIAVPLVKGSDVLILDEPTSGLDAENMRQVASLVKNVATEGRTVFVITHDYEFILQTCTRIVHLSKGKIKSDFLLHKDSLAQLKAIFIPTDEIE